MIGSTQEFLDFARTWNKFCCSQLGQDLWVLQNFGKQPEPYFIEIGAYDGKDISNTFLLEKLGWRGLVVEPNPNLIDALRRHRTCAISGVAVAPFDGRCALQIVDENPELTRLRDYVPDDNHETSGRRESSTVISVECAKPRSLLTSYSVPKSITYVSIDTEGSELSILESFPFDEYVVECFSIEHNYSSNRSKIFDLMKANGFSRVMTDWSEFDDWYVHNPSEVYPITIAQAEQIFTDSFKMNIDGLPGNAHFLAKLNQASPFDTKTHVPL